MSNEIDRHSQLKLFPVKEAEVDGIQMGILSDGSPYLTMLNWFSISVRSAFF